MDGGSAASLEYAAVKEKTVSSETKMDFVPCHVSVALETKEHILPDQPLEDPSSCLSHQEVQQQQQPPRHDTGHTEQATPAVSEDVDAKVDTS